MQTNQSRSHTATLVAHDTTRFQSVCKASVAVLIAAFAINTGSALAQSMAVKEDAAQLAADKAALHRQLKRLETDEARLKADTTSGKMSAESKDAYEVYKAQEAVKGEKAAVATDKDGSLQMKADKAALHRQIKRLEMADARLKSDKSSGKMVAESKDSMKVYSDQQAMKGEKKDIATDKTKLQADQKK